jgi:hypothetical protein
LTLQETFEVTLEVVGARAAGFPTPPDISSFLPGFPSEVPVVADVSYVALVVTMPHGDDLASAVNARATGEPRSQPGH